jgi:hypothetical protein
MYRGYSLAGKCSGDAGDRRLEGEVEASVDTAAGHLPVPPRGGEGGAKGSGRRLGLRDVRSGLVERGTTFDRAFATTPLCCPSRTSILRGQYAHNHNLWDNKAPDGGFRGFQELGLEESTVATWLDEAGYHTGFIGKYLNEYGDYEHPTTHVPADATAPNDNAYGGRTMPKTPAFNEADLSDKAALWRDNALRLVQGAEAASRCWRTSSRRWRWGRL